MENPHFLKKNSLFSTFHHQILMLTLQIQAITNSWWPSGTGRNLATCRDEAIYLLRNGGCSLMMGSMGVCRGQKGWVLEVLDP